MSDLSEKEQIEQIRAWWSEYGNFVVGGIVVGIAVMIGIRQYSAHQVATQTEASVIYEDVMEAVVDGELEAAEAAAQKLFDGYDATIYPMQARLALARLYMDKGQDADAAATLRAIVDTAPKSELGLLARLRLAKVLLYQEKPQEVVDLLQGMEESAFSPRFNETLGDAYVALERFADAEAAYFSAMNDSANAPTVERPLLQMKIDDLPETAATGAGESADTDGEDDGGEAESADTGDDTDAGDDD